MPNRCWCHVIDHMTAACVVLLTGVFFQVSNISWLDEYCRALRTVNACKVSAYHDVDGNVLTVLLLVDELMDAGRDSLGVEHHQVLAGTQEYIGCWYNQQPSKYAQFMLT